MLATKSGASLDACSKLVSLVMGIGGECGVPKNQLVGFCLAVLFLAPRLPSSRVEHAQPALYCMSRRHAVCSAKKALDPCRQSALSTARGVVASFLPCSTSAPTSGIALPMLVSLRTPTQSM